MTTAMATMRPSPRTDKPSTVLAVDQWQPDRSARFRFVDRALEPGTGRVLLRYDLDGIELVEQLVLPLDGMWLDETLRVDAAERALDLLHWVAGISYWKAGCPRRIEFGGRAPDPWQAAWLTRLYREGLAEFAYRNALDRSAWPEFRGSGDEIAAAPPHPELARRTLVPMGGGKDSLVAWSRLRRLGDAPDSVQIGNSELIRRLGDQLPGRHRLIDRQLDPALVALNRRGAWNGHVPVTAVNAAILTLAAVVLDYDRVVFANERSADEASLVDAAGREVNHQFSKSFAFEQMLDDWIQRYIAPDLRVFSLLRRDRELAICREFALLSEFHGLFSSCNRNFHLEGPRTQRWCGRCPKCHFVFLALAPFMAPDELTAIFGSDLLADPAQHEGFEALLALEGGKPFECVGEADEARAAVQALARHPDWCDHPVVRALEERLSRIRVPDLDRLCQPTGPHRIPLEWQHAA
jgi:hypothetical protein